jgi:molybdate transport system regulatory protein
MKKQALFSGDALGYDVVDKRMDILRRIGTAGSISEAARAAGVSYKAAWQAVDTLTNLAGTPLLERTVGGSGGGGAVLTEAGQQLLQVADAMHAMRQRVLQEHAASSGAPPLPWGGLGLQTSMRNQLPCRLVRLKTLGRAARVEVALADGSALFSRITKESAELLGLRAGLDLLALAKATAVHIGADDTPAGDAPPAPSNRLAGLVARIARATSGDEVVVTLRSGLQLVGFSEPGVRLQTGQTVWASLDESAVVLATAG